jgi:hypothetical protein
MNLKKYFKVCTVAVSVLTILSCGKETAEGELILDLMPTTAAVVPVQDVASCRDRRDYKYQISEGSSDATMARSLSGNLFWFASLQIQYTGYEKYETLNKSVYIDFNDSRIGGSFRCDITLEADAFFDATVFNSSGKEAKDGSVDGIFKSTSECKIYCTQALNVAANMKQKEFTVTGLFKVRFTVQKKDSDEPAVNIFAQEPVTVLINVD